jgi:Sulfate permease family
VKVPDLWFSGTTARVEPWPILGAAANYGALIVVTASTVLLNTMGAEVETRIDADLDRELRITGLSNLLSGALGGMIGTLSLSRTLFSYRVGARRRIGGFVTGAVCFLTLGFGTEALGYIPVPLVGALLMQLGAAVLYEWLVEGRRRMLPLEYALLVAILLVIVLWDFVAGMAVGDHCGPGTRDGRRSAIPSAQSLHEIGAVPAGRAAMRSGRCGRCPLHHQYRPCHRSVHHAGEQGNPPAQHAQAHGGRRDGLLPIGEARRLDQDRRADDGLCALSQRHEADDPRRPGARPRISHLHHLHIGEPA